MILQPMLINLETIVEAVTTNWGSYIYTAQSIEQISDLTCHKISPNADKPYIRSFHDDC